MKTKEAPETFEEYWPYYLASHRRPVTRWMHFGGISFYFVSWIPFILFMKMEYLYFPLAGLLGGYVLSAVTHVFIEHNHPNARHPLWGVRALWRMFGLIYIRKMNQEMMRVFGTTRPSGYCDFLIVPKDEVVAQRKLRMRISDEWVDHPFTNYFDVFLLKHQHPINLYLHLLAMGFYAGCFVLILYLKELWPVLLIFSMPLIGLIAHRKYENNYVDPEDALVSPRALLSLWKMVGLWLVGRYWSEVEKRQAILKTYHHSKRA
jgi:hypothetical protein